MKARQISRLLFAGVAISLVYGVASSARADDGNSVDPFAAVESIEKLDLDDLRGGHVLTLEFYETNATNNAWNTTNVDINTSTGEGGTAGNVTGGDVTFSDSALQNFGGIWTSAITTAPAGIASAQTSVSIILNP